MIGFFLMSLFSRYETKKILYTSAQFLNYKANLIFDISPKEDARSNFIFSSFSLAIKLKHVFNFPIFWPKNNKTTGKL